MVRCSFKVCAVCKGCLFLVILQKQFCITYLFYIILNKSEKVPETRAFTLLQLENFISNRETVNIPCPKSKLSATNEIRARPVEIISRSEISKFIGTRELRGPRLATNSAVK